MSVLIETTLGELVIDVYTDDAPLAATNFLKLCKLKYFHGALFFNVQENFMVQTGDPTGTGNGGTSLYGQLYGAQANYFADEICPHLKHTKRGLVGMANSGPNTNASQFYITTRSDDLTYLDGKHTLFGEVAEGLDVLEKLNQLFVDQDNRPFQDVRITHTYVLDDPFPDPPLLVVPPHSPKHERPPEETVEPRISADEVLDTEPTDRTEAEIEAAVRQKEAQSRAVVLEMLGDLPDADVAPPDDVLFVCKLNPVTESSDLDMAFCRFGKCKSQVIRDHKTGDSLCFAFVEFTNAKHCEEAYYKMNNVLLDDRRLKVDFSQSVSKLWNKFHRNQPMGKHDNNGEKNSATTRDKLFGKKGRVPLQLKGTKRVDEFELVEDGDDDGGDDDRKRQKERSHRRDARRSGSGRDCSPVAHKRQDDRRSDRYDDSKRHCRDQTDRQRSRSLERRRSHKRRSTSRDRRHRDRRSNSRERRSSNKRSRSRSRSRSRTRESRTTTSSSTKRR